MYYVNSPKKHASDSLFLRFQVNPSALWATQIHFFAKIHLKFYVGLYPSIL